MKKRVKKKISIISTLLIILLLIFLYNIEKPSCPVCKYSDEIGWLLNESEIILDYQINHTIDGFPVTVWNVLNNTYLNSVSNPRFIQYWNLATLRGGGKALEYMIEVMNTFYNRSVNGVFPWYYNLKTKKIEKSTPLISYVVGDLLMGLGYIYEMTNNSVFKERATELANHSIELFFNEDNNLLYNYLDFNLQPLKSSSEIGNVCLLIDGWLFMYDVFGDEHYLKSAEKAIDGILSLKNNQTGLIPEIFIAENKSLGAWSGIGTLGEFMETVYYAWYLTDNSRYVDILKNLIDTQIEFFWNDDLGRFINKVDLNGFPLDYSYEAIRLEPNIYMLIRLYAITKNETYLNLSEKALNSYMNEGFVEGLPLFSIGDNKTLDLVCPGSIYPFLKSAAMISMFKGDFYLNQSLEVAKKSVKLIKQKYGYASCINITSGEILPNQDIGGTMWFQNEGLTILASMLMVYPHWDLGESGKSSVVPIAENSIIRGFQVKQNGLEFELGTQTINPNALFCFNNENNDLLSRVSRFDSFYYGEQCVYMINRGLKPTKIFFR